VNRYRAINGPRRDCDHFSHNDACCATTVSNRLDKTLSENGGTAVSAVQFAGFRHIRRLLHQDDSDRTKLCDRFPWVTSGELIVSFLPKKATSSHDQADWMLLKSRSPAEQHRHHPCPNDVASLAPQRVGPHLSQSFTTEHHATAQARLAAQLILAAQLSTSISESA
jgi:hypothetical protein